jgi:hypothetical protein
LIKESDSLFFIRSWIRIPPFPASSYESVFVPISDGGSRGHNA